MQRLVVGKDAADTLGDVEAVLLHRRQDTHIALQRGQQDILAL